MTVVMASAGYPGTYEKGAVISGLETAKGKEDVFIFHAGTAKNDSGSLIASGGRVLSVTALGETLKAAKDKAYEVIYEIRFAGAQFRKDIGRRALDSVRS